MSYIPSERIRSALPLATVGVWLERIADGRTALVCKVPETAIKAVLRGARTSLLIGEVPSPPLRVLCLGMTIQDEADRPLAIQKPTSAPEDMALLTEVLSASLTTVHFMNELDHPVLSAWCQLEQTAAATAAKDFAACDPWVLTPESSLGISTSAVGFALELAMDRFQRYIFSNPGEPASTAVAFATRIPLTLQFWNRAQTAAVTAAGESEPFAIDDVDEGRKLERLGGVVLDAMYPGNSYHSPQVRDGPTVRELVDLLGFDHDWICLVEAKAMSIKDSPSLRSSDRRKANVEMSIAKGLGQLSGALRNIRSGAAVFQINGGALTSMNRKAPAHAIVLLSEMYSFVDWRATAGAVVAASENDVHRALFHVFDLNELARLASDCVNGAAFNRRLLQRWCLVKERGTAYGRVRRPP